MNKWIDGETLSVGDIGFLVSRDHTSSRAPATYHIGARPAHTNSSHQPRLTGWCGETNNVSIHAHGLARVVRTARNGRAQVVALTAEEIPAALETLGYPELAAT